MPTRHQRGYVYPKKNRWYVRYYENILQPDGMVKRVQRAQSVAPVCYEYRAKRSVMPLVTELLSAVNDNHFSPEGTLKLEQFVESNYLPHVANQKRPSTFRGYRNMWKCYLKPKCGDIRLSDFRTADGERLLAEIAKRHDLSRTSLRHIVSFR